MDNKLGFPLQVLALRGLSMRATDPFDHAELAKHLKLQRKAAWDLDTCVNWSIGVDYSKILLPLDEGNIAFPGASREQAAALSQLMGLIVNSTISEMEDCLPRLKKYAWEDVLRDYPVGPELRDLGEQFFEEEAKHASAFKKYLEIFCTGYGIDQEDLDLLVPKAFGSHFQSAIINNARSGGRAFWWVVSSVEEVSINIYHEMFRQRADIDPLFFNLHRRHLEEESRHANYAYLMLELMDCRRNGLRGWWHKKADFTWAQLVTMPWVITELQKFFKVKDLRHKHPFFEVLASCIPLYESMPVIERVRRVFVAAPYVSWILNPNHRSLHKDVIDRDRAWLLPFPEVPNSAEQ
jgi:hypothetical protein